jgi:ketosteroid isomerase-like protein
MNVRADVHDLLARHALAMDAHDWDALTACYAPDATYIHPGGELSGVDAIVDRTRNALGTLDASQHLIGTVLVTPGPGADEASAVSYFQGQHVRRGLPDGELFVIAGTYRDLLARCGGAWVIVQRTQEYTWRDGNPAVVGRAAARDPVADELAIRQLTAAYTDALNRGDLDDVAHVYADDARFTMMDRPTVEGRDAIVEVLRATVARYRLVMQLVHSGVVLVDGDSARARWQITELQVPVDGPPRFIAGRYEDEHARRNDGWVFTSRTYTARYLGGLDLTDPVLPDRPPLFPLWPS